jgi:hypothetical protein
MRVRAKRPRGATDAEARFEWPPLRILLPLAAGLALIAVLVWMAARQGNAEWRSEIVTVVGPAAGPSGGGAFEHLVRLPDGTQASLAFGTALGRDERLRVEISRTDGGIVFRKPVRCGTRPDC